MEDKSVFKEFDTQDFPLRRRDLLPLWIKIFIWIFLFTGIAGVLLLAFGFFLDDTDLSIYGLSTTRPYSLIGYVISFIFIFKGIVSYGLWFEEKWAPKAAMADAILGFIICGVVMFVLPFTSSTNFTIRFEIILLIPYLQIMRKIENKWINLK
ncbi:hypothetical protein [Chryseobacterium tongliaoense]|uniref:hypothetical protein n=1 Tax=Chryseobacterium tongliaoense TaxID=3240933 RepID=UPI00351762FB